MKRAVSLILFLASVVLVAPAESQAPRGDSPEPTPTKLGAALLSTESGIAHDPVARASDMLAEAKKMLEPFILIQDVVRLLDSLIDQRPRDVQCWKLLGEALPFGGDSRHVRSLREVWARVFELDSTDCHAGCLWAFTLPDSEAAAVARRLRRRFPNCPEAHYARAELVDTTSQPRIAALITSVRLKPSAEANTLLGSSLNATLSYHEAVEAFAAALDSPVLFPEHWRPDVRNQVHAQLGLAWSLYRLGNMDKAKSHYVEFVWPSLEPGPWHDLTTEEKAYRDSLEQVWPGVRDSIQKAMFH
jgi:hypothetical protein